MDKRRAKVFSKEQSSTDRSALAIEVTQKRKTYFNQKHSSLEQVSQLESELMNHRLKLDQLTSEIATIETTLGEIKSSKISQLLNLFERWRLEKKLAVKSKSLDETGKEYATLEQTLSQLRDQANAADELETVKSSVSRFYGEQAEKLAAYEADRKNRDVAHIIEKHDAIFIHAIHANFVPADNSLVYSDIDWKTKLDIVLAFSPTLSTSTIRTGETQQNMWARMGVILKGGSVSEARSADAATVATGLKKRSSSARGSDQTGNIEKDIEHAVTSERSGYNELVLENPDVAGFYVCLDDTGNIIRKDLAPLEQIVGHVKEQGIPLYVIKDGDLYEGVYDADSQTLRPGNKLDKRSVTKSEFQINDEVRNRAVNNIYEKAPFKIRSSEVHDVESYYCGNTFYIELRALETLNSREQLDYELPQTEVKGVSWREMYKTENGKLFKSSLYRDGGFAHYRTAYGKSFTEIQHNEVMSKYIRLGSGSIDDLARDIHARKDYLEGMIDKIRQVQEKRQATLDESRSTDFHDKWLSQLAFHLHGFAEQAGKYNDMETAMKAKEAAALALPVEVYEDIARRRMSPDGGFKWTQEDLG